MEFTSRLRRLAVAPLPVPAGWYALPLRLIVGFGFVQHGYAKVSRGADGFIAILHAIRQPRAQGSAFALRALGVVLADEMRHCREM